MKRSDERQRPLATTTGGVAHDGQLELERSYLYSDFLAHGAGEGEAAVEQENGWGSAESVAFIGNADLFVPERELQIDTLCQLLGPQSMRGTVLEICCGDGRLAEAILQTHPGLQMLLLDGSPEMLEEASARMSRYSGRFQTQLFDIHESAWRDRLPALSGAVSSLAIHHLDGAGKRQLFSDLRPKLLPGSALVIADIVAPATERAKSYAAWSWDREVSMAADRLERPEALDEFRTDGWNYYAEPSEQNPEDQPSPLLDQLLWLRSAGFGSVDVYWMKSGHAIFGGIANGEHSEQPEQR